MIFWDRYYKYYDRFTRTSPTYQKLVEDILLVGCDRSKKILDLGCGSGYLSIELIKRGCQVTSIDNSKTAIQLLRERSNHTILMGDITKGVQAHDNSFDTIISINVLYTLSAAARQKIINEFMRLLKSGGTVIITDPKKHFSNIRIFLSDVKFFLENGYLSAIIKTIKEIGNYIPLFVFNLILDLQEKKRIYMFCDLAEYRSVYEKDGLRVEASGYLYAGQNVMLRLKKE